MNLIIFYCSLSWSFRYYLTCTMYQKNIPDFRLCSKKKKKNFLLLPSSDWSRGNTVVTFSCCSFSAKHTVLLCFYICETKFKTKKKKRKNNSPALTVCQLLNDRGKTVKSQCCCYMIVCINTSRARLCPLGCVWVCRLREDCLLL